LRAYIVVDLGFGDCGKGLLTDTLARRTGAGVVVRYNGGAQAGHNVVAPDGRQHTFSQFGSGTLLPGVKTYLSKHVVIHPAALLAEGNILVGKGVGDAFSRLRVSEQALVITPFHQAANHIREMARGAQRHGSCGVGVGEAVEDAQMHGADCVRAGDLSNPSALRRKLRSIRERKRAQLVELVRDGPPGEALAREWALFESEDGIDEWISRIAPIGEHGLVVPDAVLQGWLQQTEHVVFEGAQGVLLDADAGFHPYTTWSRCTAANAYDLIQEMAPGAEALQIGVMRCYAVRHGPGPLPSETDELTALVAEHNRYNEWQGRVRYGWFDAVLARYALAAAGRLDSLLVTHLDVLPRLKAWNCCTGYTGQLDSGSPAIETQVSGGILNGFRLPPALPLAQREQFTRALFGVTPVLELCEPEAGAVIRKIEALIGQPVGMVSDGPRAEDISIFRPIPN